MANAASPPAAISARQIAVGDVFQIAKELEVSFERLMYYAGRQGRVNKGVTGGRSKRRRYRGALIVEVVMGGAWL